MQTRKDFLKNAMLMTGGMFFSDALCASIYKAANINPANNSSYLDAEHIVFLMQENRSFDHMFGSMQGVRGFDDPRAIHLHNGNKVWLQMDEKNDTYLPFHLDILNTKATWMSDLPHSWTDQTDARNNGSYDKWLIAKKSGRKEYKHMPLTMGYYNRIDLPFYYTLADAFTICDQNFCSVLSSTTPNRLHFWSGTLRDRKDKNMFANVWNQDAKPWNLVDWKTFPERLQEEGISWKVYQNELYKQGLAGEEEDWLDNFGDNTLENFKQFNVHAYNKAAYNNLSASEKELHDRAFCTNKKDPDYRTLTPYTYHDGKQQREINIPKSDVLMQFRSDVEEGKLPTVSWLVPSGKFSDHPGHPWFGQWYISEVFNILTKNPEVWKKTIFVLTYDENDGYFDHIPPYVPPHPNVADTGKLSSNLDAKEEYVFDISQQSDQKNARIAPIGLGYRVPMIIASPWSRGGWVNSEIFDHTSSLQFLERFFEKKLGKAIFDNNISAWRRNICGDLTSSFREFKYSDDSNIKFFEKNELIERVHKAKFKDVPTNFKRLTSTEIYAVNQRLPDSLLPKQEPGTRPSVALTYTMDVNAKLMDDDIFKFVFQVSDKVFGKDTVGAPFIVYKYNKENEPINIPRNYAVSPADTINDSWQLDKNIENTYHFAVQGPNGFFREFKGDIELKDIDLIILHDYDVIRWKKKAHLKIIISCNQPSNNTVSIIHHAYNKKEEQVKLLKGQTEKKLDFANSHGWYDFSVIIKQNNKSLSYRYAGRIETGKHSITDPLIGAK